MADTPKPKIIYTKGGERFAKQLAGHLKDFLGTDVEVRAARMVDRLEPFDWMMGGYLIGVLVYASCMWLVS